MSRKPYIKIVYPDASGVAMMLTEAMIRRTSGKRVVETTSTDKCEDDAGTLFSGVDACRTETSVELTLNLIPAAMDYALTQLIAKNLTKDERESILKSADGVELLSILAPLAEVETTASEKKPETEPEIEIGKIRDRDLRDILEDLVYNTETGRNTDSHDLCIQYAIDAINHAAGVIDLDETYEQKDSALVFKQDIEAIICNALEDHFPNLDTVAAKLTADDLARRLNLHTRIACDPNHGYDRHQIEIALAVLLYAAPDREWDQEDVAEWAAHVYDMLHPLIPGSHPNFIDPESIKNLLDECELIAARRGNVITAQSLARELSDQDYQKRLEKDRQEKEQENISGEKPKKAKKSRKKKQDPSWDDVETEARQMQAPAPKQSAAPLADDGDGEIEPGLLNDLDDGSDGMAPAEEVIGHDE